MRDDGTWLMAIAIVMVGLMVIAGIAFEGCAQVERAKHPTPQTTEAR